MSKMSLSVCWSLQQTETHHEAQPLIHYYRFIIPFYSNLNNPMAISSGVMWMMFRENTYFMAALEM